MRTDFRLGRDERPLDRTDLERQAVELLRADERWLPTPDHVGGGVAVRGQVEGLVDVAGHARHASTRVPVPSY